MLHAPGLHTGLVSASNDQRLLWRPLSKLSPRTLEKTEKKLRKAIGRPLKNKLSLQSRKLVIKLSCN